MPISRITSARARALSDPSRLVATTEAAQIMGVTEETLLCYRSIGKLPADVELSREEWLAQGKPRARLYYRVSSLIEYMKRTKPTYPRQRRQK